MRLGSIKGSSHLKAVGFEGGPGDKATLRIKFDDDAVIDFFKVPYSVFRGLVAAKDHSQFYFKHIYGQFDYKKI